MGVQLIGETAMHQVISHLEGVKHAVHDEAKTLSRKAEANLREARSSTRWYKILGPGHLTSISVSQGDVDSFVNLNAPNPLAIEFGHAPSGVFGPGGRYGHIKTKAPEGLYILTRAVHS
jgi:hypothetical protein